MEQTLVIVDSLATKIFFIKSRNKHSRALFTIVSLCHIVQDNLCQVSDQSASSLFHCQQPTVGCSSWFVFSRKKIFSLHLHSCCEGANRNEYQVVLVGTLCHFFPLRAGSSLLEWPK